MHPAPFLASFLKYPTKIIEFFAPNFLLIIIIYYFRMDFNITPILNFLVSLSYRLMS
jgi:hypothetical protein